MKKNQYNEKDFSSDKILVKLSNDTYLFAQWGSEPAAGNEVCIDYTLFNKDKQEIDGGQLDVESADYYSILADSIPDLIEFHYLDCEEYPTIIKIFFDSEYIKSFLNEICD